MTKLSLRPVLTMLSAVAVAMGIFLGVVDLGFAEVMGVVLGN